MLLYLFCNKSHYENVPFEIPESWCWCTLSELCIFLSRGKSPKYSEERLFPVFAQKCNLKDGGISLDQARFLDPSTIGKWGDDYKLKSGDVLVNSTGTGTVGRTRLFDECCLGEYPFVVPDSHVSVVRTVTEIDSFYICAILSSNWGQQYLEDNLAGSTNQKELYIGVLEDMFIPLPPKNEQKKIAKEITRWEMYVYNIDVVKAELSNYIKQTKSKILDLVISGKLVPQDPNDEPAIELLKRINPAFEPCDNSHYGNLPQGWVVCRLEDVCQICDNQRQPINSTERQERKKRAQTLYPYYGATGQVDWIDDYMLDGTFILLGEDGAPFLEKFADKAYVVSGKIWVNNHAHILKPNCDITYLTYYLNRYDYSKCVNGSTRLKLTQADMKNMTIVLPPLVEQHRIAGRIENIFRMLDAITAEL